eukprot:3941432-Rhodomonas_salina.8
MCTKRGDYTLSVAFLHPIQPAGSVLRLGCRGGLYGGFRRGMCTKRGDYTLSVASSHPIQPAGCSGMQGKLVWGCREEDDGHAKARLRRLRLDSDLGRGSRPRASQGSRLGQQPLAAAAAAPAPRDMPLKFELDSASERCASFH